MCANSSTAPCVGPAVPVLIFSCCSVFQRYLNCGRPSTFFRCTSARARKYTRAGTFVIMADFNGAAYQRAERRDGRGGSGFLCTSAQHRDSRTPQSHRSEETKVLNPPSPSCGPDVCVCVHVWRCHRSRCSFRNVELAENPPFPYDNQSLTNRETNYLLLSRT